MTGLRRLVLLAALVLPVLAGCEEEEPAIPQPGPFEAGVGTARMPAPLGIGTAGFSGIGVSSPPSPFADLYPATSRIHGHPEFRAVSLSRGDGFRVVFLRSDMVATIQQLRDAVVDSVQARTGVDLSDGLVFGATHTHSGPGRFIQGGLFRLIADDFLPEFYARLVDAAADAVVAALEDQSPAELATTTIQAPDAHNDRRCEDGIDYTNDALPLVAVRKEGQLAALVGAYAIHGTVLGIGDLTLSQDVYGAIEEAIEDRFDHPVQVLLFNSWGGDMAPEQPEGEAPEVLSEMPNGYDRMDAIGLYLGEQIEAGLAGLTFESEPPVEAQTVRFPIDTANIGYGPGEFSYLFGGVYCSTSSATCDEVLVHDGLADACIPFPEDSPAPMQSYFTVGQVGGLHLTTWPGECSTGLAEEVLANMQGEEGVGEVLFVGYSNDYLGYTLQEEDWWHGGYEASGAMWGPRQGDYMKEVQAQVFAQYRSGADPSFDPPEAAPSFDLTQTAPYSPSAASGLGTVRQQPASSVAVGETVTIEVLGADPWHGAPRVTVQVQGADGTFSDLPRRSGKALDSDGYGFWLDLLPEPSYSEAPDATERQFVWRVSMAVSRRDLGLEAELSGTYRFRVELPDGSEAPVEIPTEPFVLSP